MFTGIIQAVGKVHSIEARGGDCRIRIQTAGLDLQGTQLGDSIAANGVCLTAVALPGDGYVADVSRETLAHTTLGELRPGAAVNLEKALTLATPLGGHLVSGHVDGVGEVLERREEARSIRLSIQAPADLARYIAARGSICIDGASLTVNSVEGARFTLNIVPHTQDQTIMRQYCPGSRVNIEVDLVARYLERLLQGEATPGRDSGVSLDLLARTGFLGR